MPGRGARKEYEKRQGLVSDNGVLIQGSQEKTVKKNLNQVRD